MIVIFGAVGYIRVDHSIGSRIFQDLVIKEHISTYRRVRNMIQGLLIPYLWCIGRSG